MPRLMIVDDEPEITAMLKRYFVREGYETVTALTGAEALRKLRCAPDMVLLDVNLPDMDGFAVCRALREHLDCPVLFLTARVEDADKLSGFASGGDDYVLKPFSIDELGARGGAPAAGNPARPCRRGAHGRRAGHQLHGPNRYL